MNILHLTDFHFSTKSSQQIRVVNAIISEIKTRNLVIDFVFFTGDLVFKGTNVENFQQAQNVLFYPIISELNVKKENIIICPGNHDINRNAIHSAIKSYISDQIRSNENLNDFYSRRKAPDVFNDSIAPIQTYNQFRSEFYPENSSNILKDLYSIHYRTYGGKKMGILCLNSAWLSAIDKEKTGKSDKGNLLVPISLLEEANLALQNVAIKIVLIHHPLYFLSEFNYSAVESFIHNEFSLLFLGHVHKLSASTRHSGTNGLFEHVAKASLSSNEALGCSFLQFNEDQENEIFVNEITYLEDANACHFRDAVVHTIPSGSEKHEILNFRKKVSEKISVEKQNACSLLLTKDEDSSEDFLNTYTHPLLKSKQEGTAEAKNAEAVSLEDLVSSKSNYLILGKDKCGKTSLLKRIQIEALSTYSRTGKIPLYYDAKEFDTKEDNETILEQTLLNYYSINKRKRDLLLTGSECILLIDNYNPKSAFALYFENFLNKYSEIRYIVCSEFNITRAMDLFPFGETSNERLFFHDLRRKEIVTFTEKRLANVKKKEDIQEKIILLCKQLELPLNYWTISLLLLIYNKTTDSISKNIFSILDICIDEIFSKKKLALENGRLTFDQLKRVCAELAKYLFEEHRANVFSASRINILSQIKKTKEVNNRIVADENQILDYLISSSILKVKTDESGLIVFRLNGFFEYFLALQMTKDSIFKDSIMNDEEKYLAFKNQFEIYSGFKRDDLDFLERIFNKTSLIFSNIFKNYNENKDSQLIEIVSQPSQIENIIRSVSVQRALSSYEKADIQDMSEELKINAEVHPLSEYDPSLQNSELVERYLSILARVYRNSDEIYNKQDKLLSYFRFILNSYCDFSFFIVEEFKQITKAELYNESNTVNDFLELELLRLVSNFSPIISQSAFFDGVGHYNIERTVLMEIELLERDIENNQFKLFLLYFLLIDIDLVKYKNYIDTALQNIRIPVLRYSIFLKLNFYLAFKSGSNKSLQQFLSAKIQEVTLKMDSKSDLSELHKRLQERKKISTLNKD